MVTFAFACVKEENKFCFICYKQRLNNPHLVLSAPATRRDEIISSDAAANRTYYKETTKRPYINPLPKANVFTFNFYESA